VDIKSTNYIISPGLQEGVGSYIVEGALTDGDLSTYFRFKVFAIERIPLPQ